MRIACQMAALSLLLSATSPAVPRRLAPNVYRVDGRPVPVSCLEPLTDQEREGAHQPIDLRTCGDPALRPKSRGDGTIGYEEPGGGYFYYHYVGRSGEVDVLSLEDSGGGTGRFTALVGVRRDGHFLRWVVDYAAGDRCNGGISNASVTNGRLRFDQAITPYDLVKLARPRTTLEAYKDLDASAASCIGVAHQAGDDAHWTGVTLSGDDQTDREGWTENFRYQSCFNALCRETVARVGDELDRSKVAAFGEAFERRCMHLG